MLKNISNEKGFYFFARAEEKTKKNKSTAGIVNRRIRREGVDTVDAEVIKYCRQENPTVKNQNFKG